LNACEMQHGSAAAAVAAIPQLKDGEPSFEDFFK
jgi:hypothetical protein